MTSSISITSNSGFFLRSVRLIAFFPLSRLSIDSKRTFCKPHSYWQLSHPELRCIDASASDHQHLTLNLLENVWGQRKIDQEDNTNRQIICPIVQCGLMSSRASLAVRFTNPIPEIQIRIGTEVQVLIKVCGGMGVKIWCDGMGYVVGFLVILVHVCSLVGMFGGSYVACPQLLCQKEKLRCPMKEPCNSTFLNQLKL